MFFSKYLERKRQSSGDFIETLKHGWIYLSGKLAVKGLALISLPIMTRLLSPEDYGILNIFATYGSMALILFSLNLTASIGRYYHEKKPDFPEFLGTAVTVPLFLILIQLSIAFSFLKTSLS